MNLSGPVHLAENNTLGGGHAHVYVTRAATLEFCALTHLNFEESRRELTRLLLHAMPVTGDRRRWTVEVPGYHPGAFAASHGVNEVFPSHVTLVAYVVPDGDLLVVGNVSLAQDAPDAHYSGPPSEASP